VTSRSSILLLGTALVFAACDEDAGSVAAGGAGAGGYEAPPDGAIHLLGDPQLGDPELTSAQRIGFASGGVLLVGDGASNRIVAIETGDVDRQSRSQHVFERVDQLARRVSAVLDGQGSGEVWIHDIAINPLSFRIYLAVTHYGLGEVAILWVDGKGHLHPLALDQVIYAAAGYSMPTTGTTTTELGWTEGYAVGSLTNQAGRLLAVEAPIEHESNAVVSSPRFYHKGWGTWLDDMVVDGMLLMRQDDMPWMVAAFADGPLVRFPVELVAVGLEKSVGITFADFGVGRVVKDMAFHDRKEGGAAVLLIHDYWNDVTTRGLRVARSMLMQVGATNEDAPLLLDYLGVPASPLVERLEDLDGSERITPVPDRSQVVVLRQDALEWIELSE
jgi:hypothetical protein